MNKPKTFKRMITCSCHRMHKNKKSKHKCRLHRHNIYYGKPTTNTKKIRSNRVSFKLPTSNKTSKHRIVRIQTPYYPPMKAHGLTNKIPSDLILFANTIEKIQKCDDLDKCGEIKNFITVNVCSVYSSIREIMFYYHHLSKSTQHAVLNRVIEFGRTM